MCIFMDGSELPLPPNSELISDNRISVVFRGNDGFIYKRSIPFLIQNELYCLKKLEGKNVSPRAVLYDKYTLKIDDLGTTQVVTDEEKFRFYAELVLVTLQNAGIRHGDLTTQSIIVVNNRPYIIDFAESRLACDPRVDKRQEGDDVVFKRAVEELCYDGDV